MRPIRVKMASAVLVALGSISAFAAPMAAEAVDLTGTWEGKAICKGYLLGDKFSFTKESFGGRPMTITQVGSFLTIQFIGWRYNGAIQTDNTSPLRKAQGSFVGCSTVNDYSNTNEIGSFTATLNLANDSASQFKATSVLTNSICGGVGCSSSETNGDVSICKWTFKRTSTTNPNVPECD